MIITIDVTPEEHEKGTGYGLLAELICSVFNNVASEWSRASEKFPEFNSRHEGYAILLGETAELFTAIRGNSALQAHAEAMQVAAMAIRFMVDCHPAHMLDGKEKWPPKNWPRDPK